MYLPRTHQYRRHAHWPRRLAAYHYRYAPKGRSDSRLTPVQRDDEKNLEAPRLITVLPEMARSRKVKTMNTKALGEKIRKARKALKLHQKDVAKQVGLSRATIIAIEKGRTVPRYDKMVRLTTLLHL